MKWDKYNLDLYRSGRNRCDMNSAQPRTRRVPPKWIATCVSPPPLPLVELFMHAPRVSQLLGVRSLVSSLSLFLIAQVKTQLIVTDTDDYRGWSYDRDWHGWYIYRDSLHYTL